MSLDIKPVTADNLDDLGRLFGCHEMSERCWCMWWIIPVKEFWKEEGSGNQAMFRALAAASELPMGLLAYREGEAVGWCAVGPRERYARGIKTPTYRGGDKDEQGVWLAPCFFVHPDARGQGVHAALLEAALKLAKQHGATAVEGFPFAGDKRRSGGQENVGFEAAFAACGFETVRQPSDSRVVMRRELG